MYKVNLQFDIELGKNARKCLFDMEAVVMNYGWRIDEDADIYMCCHVMCCNLSSEIAQELQ